MGENPTDRQQFRKFCNQETWRRGKLLHQKELVDAFDENKKNEGKQIGTGRGGSDGDNADCRASAPAGGHPAMDADEASDTPSPQQQPGKRRPALWSPPPPRPRPQPTPHGLGAT